MHAREDLQTVLVIYVAKMHTKGTQSKTAMIGLKESSYDADLRKTVIISMRGRQNRYSE